MEPQDTERPEGVRTHEGRPLSAWRLAWQVIAVVVIFEMGTYALDTAPGPWTRIPVAILLCVLAAAVTVISVEVLVARGFPTMWLGPAIIAGWLAWNAVGESVMGRVLGTGSRLIGVAGLVLLAVTPLQRRLETEIAHRELLEQHPRYAVAREWMRRGALTAMIACTVGLALAVAYGRYFVR